MTPLRPIAETDLHAYVDGALDGRREEEVRAYLEEHADIAARVRVYASQRDALREAWGPVANEPIPAELDLQRIVERARRPMPSWRIAAAVVTMLAVGGASGWLARGLSEPASSGVAALAREAADSYRVYAADPRRPVEIGPAGRADLVSWVSARLGSPVSAPDLSKAGYRFIGGRLVSTPHGAAAMFIYDGADGARLAVMVRPMAVERNTRMSERREGELGGVSWADRGMGYSLVGPASPHALHPLANDLRRQLDRPVVD
ncbi:MAG: anti-sigma factor [Caulobacteraceae bacterium]